MLRTAFIVPAVGMLLALTVAGLQPPSLVAQLDGAGEGETEQPQPDMRPGVAEPLRFGIDAGGIDEHAAHALAPDYGSLWVGRWNLEKGWRATDETLATLAARDIEPFVHFYYWGDDIHASCFAQGCNGKTLAGWEQLTRDLAWHLQEHLDGANATIVLETEFNKHQVKDNEDLDWYLSQRALELKAAYPAAHIVLGLGNWNPDAWDTWDRAAAASDAVGIQAIAASTRDADPKRAALFEDTLAGVQELSDRFGKPVVVTDVAVSSYPEPAFLQDQEALLGELAGGFDELAAAGAEAIVYRSMRDVPDMATSNHYGDAERHWGLAWAHSGELKPGGKVWMDAVVAHKTAAAFAVDGTQGNLAIVA